MTFGEFVAAFKDETLDNDVSWRAYDIPAACNPTHIRKAIYDLKYSYAGDHALGQIAADYGLGGPGAARTLLGLWWVLARVKAGRRVRGLKLREPLP